LTSQEMILPQTISSSRLRGKSNSLTFPKERDVYFKTERVLLSAD
jgi:hypothetical protein